MDRFRCFFFRKKRSDETDRKKRIILVAGLGNPGRAYAQNRHNFGYMVIDRLITEWKMQVRIPNKYYAYALRTEATHLPLPADTELYLCRPLTFMNNSGKAIRKALQSLRADASDLLVIYDDIDLPLGKIRIRKKGSAGGHRGIQSIIDHLDRNDFARIRLGIGPQTKGTPSEEFVLADFGTAEKAVAGRVIDLTTAAARDYLDQDFDSIMNRYNSAEIIPGEPEREMR